MNVVIAPEPYQNSQPYAIHTDDAIPIPTAIPVVPSTVTPTPVIPADVVVQKGFPIQVGDNQAQISMNGGVNTQPIPTAVMNTSPDNQCKSLWKVFWTLAIGYALLQQFVTETQYYIDMSSISSCDGTFVVYVRNPDMFGEMDENSPPVFTVYLLIESSLVDVVWPVEAQGKISVGWLRLCYTEEEGLRSQKQNTPSRHLFNQDK